MFKKWFFRLFFLFILVYGFAVLGVYFFQERIIFPGEALPANYSFQFDQPFEEHTVAVNGAELNALHFKQPSSRGLVFFLHGNAGNLNTWTVGVDYYQKVNYDMFIFDYRGYGKSTGTIDSEQQLHNDVLAAWNYVSAQYPDKPILIYGRSLGAALAVKLASHVRHEQLVLVSPFTSIKDLAKLYYSYIPYPLLDYVLRYPLETNKIINEVNSNIIFFHGDKDTFIPPSHSQKLQSLVHSSSELFIVKGADHSDIHSYPSYIKKLTAVLP